LIKATLHLIQTNRQSRNFFFYLIDSFSHVYLNRETMFTATALSEQGLLMNITDTPSSVSSPTPIPSPQAMPSGIPLYQWLDAIINPKSGPAPDLTVGEEDLFRPVQSFSSVCVGNDCDVLFQR
jgi:hypothetical protein